MILDLFLRSDDFISKESRGISANSSRPGDAYMRQCFEQIMACRLIGAKPLSEPMQVYC